MSQQYLYDRANKPYAIITTHANGDQDIRALHESHIAGRYSKGRDQTIDGSGNHRGRGNLLASLVQPPVY